MPRSKKRRVLVGVTGSVAAYKTCSVVRGLATMGYDVRVIPTADSLNFIGEIMWRALSGNDVLTDLYHDKLTATPHIHYPQDCRAFLIAPATANTIGKIANGVADNMLTACAIATTAKLIVAPAMNSKMYESAANQANLQTLIERGVKIIGPDEGTLACGDEGKGRMSRVEQLIATVVDACG
jgi:phosphopantothenoylcysteine decarboxylase / phosphopantothenate---cysteine ligase